MRAFLRHLGATFALAAILAAFAVIITFAVIGMFVNLGLGGSIVTLFVLAVLVVTIITNPDR